MTAISGTISGVLGSSAAKKAGKSQAAAAQYAADIQYKMFQESMKMQEPFRQGGMWALEQLIGTAGVNRESLSPEGQAQRKAGETWGQSGISARNAPGYIGGPNGWDKFSDKEKFISKNKNALEAMLPPGMRVKDLPGWERWIMNPVPVDQYGTPLRDVASQEAGTTTPGLLTEGAPKLDFNAFKDSPWYTLQLNEGRKALESSAAGRGMLNSGNFGKALTKYGQDYAYGKAMDVHQQNVSDWVTTKLNPLLSVLGGGQVASGKMGSQAMQSGENLGSTAMYGGAAQASSYLGQANALQQGVGQAGSGLGLIAGGVNWKNLFNKAAAPAASGKEAGSILTKVRA